MKMKYMTVWSIAPENIKASIKRFKEADPKPGSGVKLLNRWHEVGTGKGYALFEVDDYVELSRFLFAWADLVDQKVVPVVEDEEIAKALSE
jgi:hypothetical protein